MSRQAIDELKRQIPLLDYLQAHGWTPARRLNRSRWMGLCPLHPDRKPSFLVDSDKSLFYCFGCQRGGDVIRFVELSCNVGFPQALALLHQSRGRPSLLAAVASFYYDQLQRHPEAIAYMRQRGVHSPEVIQHMRIGYARGGCLRSWLIDSGFPADLLRRTGLINGAGLDAYTRRIVFPLENNLYGRSISIAAPPHRFLPGPKGGLYGWEQVRQSQEIVLVEGLFDYAVLWQAGFRNITCSMGTHLNARQFEQLCDAHRTVYVTFDSDANGSGQHAADSLAQRLVAVGLGARQVRLPNGHDPNSFFVGGGDTRQFRSLMEAARP